jgi:hypothetical protein
MAGTANNSTAAIAVKAFPAVLKVDMSLLLCSAPDAANGENLFARDARPAVVSLQFQRRSKEKVTNYFRQNMASA